MSQRDYYEILGVSDKVTKEELKEVYRKLALKYHPDRNPGKKDDGIFSDITEAYIVLKDDEKRKEYDRKLDDPDDIKLRAANFINKAFNVVMSNMCDENNKFRGDYSASIAINEFKNKIENAATHAIEDWKSAKENIVKNIEALTKVTVKGESGVASVLRESLKTQKDMLETKLKACDISIKESIMVKKMVGDFDIVFTGETIKVPLNIQRSLGL